MRIEHEAKGRVYPQEFLKNKLFQSPFLKKIPGKMEEMHVLVIGYELDGQTTVREEKKHFMNIFHIYYQIKENNDIYLIEKKEIVI